MSTQADLESLLTLAKAGGLKPFVLIYGDQDYLVRQGYDRLLDVLVPEDLRAFNQDQLDGTQADVEAVLNAVATPPMLGTKAVGVYDARYFQSKSNLGDILAKAREKWLAGEALPALRHLGRAISLAEWTWEQAAAAGKAEWAEALGVGEGEAAAYLGTWLQQALAQALSAGVNAPSTGDDAGILMEGLEALQKSGLAGVTLVCATVSADARKKLFKFFHEQGHVLDFRTAEKGPQAAMTARTFLKKTLDERKLSVKTAVGERLASAFGHDLGLLDQELRKLESWAYPRTEINEADLAQVCVFKPEENVFKLTDALARKDLGTALRLLRRFVDEDPGARFQIYGLLSGEVRKMVLCRALIDEGKLGARGSGDYNTFKMQVHPRLGKELPPALGAQWRRSSAFPLYNALERARKFDAAQLRDLLASLGQADLDMKSGGADPVAVLEELCVRLCGHREEAVL